jgi:hypothetical protein
MVQRVVGGSGNKSWPDLWWSNDVWVRAHKLLSCALTKPNHHLLSPTPTHHFNNFPLYSSTLLLPQSTHCRYLQLLRSNVRPACRAEQHGHRFRSLRTNKPLPTNSTQHSSKAPPNVQQIIPAVERQLDAELAEQRDQGQGQPSRE